MHPHNIRLRPRNDHHSQSIHDGPRKPVGKTCKDPAQHIDPEACDSCPQQSRRLNRWFCSQWLQDTQEAVKFVLILYAKCPLHNKDRYHTTVLHDAYVKE